MPSRTKDLALAGVVLIGVIAAIMWFGVAPHIVTQRWSGGGYIRCRKLLNGQVQAQNSTYPGWMGDPNFINGRLCPPP